MAKKPLYSPNLGLISGARNVAEAESKSFSSGSSLVKGFMGVFQANMLEKEKSKALVDAYASSVKTPDNITLLDEKNKPKVLNFVRNIRNEVIELSKAYAKTRDVNILDEIQMKKASIVNLSNQINGYTNEAKQYIKADRAGQIARGKNFAFEKHDSIWTKNGELNIEANGDLGFTTDSGYDRYNDITNTWNVNNNTYNTALLKIDEGVYGNAQKGGNFDRTGVINNLQSFLSQQGPEEVQVALESNIAGDDRYVIGQDDKGEDIYAANLSFEAMWSSGQLNEKFYKGFKPMNEKGEYDSSWMFQNANVGQAATLLATYNTDVLQTRHTNNFIKKEDRTKQSNYLETSFGSKSKIRANKFVNDVKNKKKEIRDLNGNEFILQPISQVYKSVLKNKQGKSITRTPIQMLESNEMDAYYPNIYQELLETPRDTSNDFIDFKDLENQNTFGKDNLSPTNDPK